MSEKPENLILITDDGLRLDGRRADEIRPMKIEIGVLSRADGSCYLEWGRNKILVGVFGPREAHPRRSQRADSAVIRYKYNMASFSVEDRARPGPSRRSIEISKVSREAFEPVILAELYPKTAIDIFVEVLQADAGTRTAAINASSIALADAGIPMKGLITSCAFGKVDGQIVLDLNKEEDNYGEADFPVAMTQEGEITLVQMDGHLTPEEIKKGLELVKKGCREILALQQAVLRKKFETPVEEPAAEAAETETEAEAESLPAPEFVSEEAAEEAEELEVEGLEEISEPDILFSSEVIPDSEEEEEIEEEFEEEEVEEEAEEGLEEEAEEDLEEAEEDLEEAEEDLEEAEEDLEEAEEDLEEAEEDLEEAEEGLEEDLEEDLEEFEEEPLEEETEFEASLEGTPEIKEFEEIEARLEKEADSGEAEEEIELEAETEGLEEEALKEEVEVEESPASEEVSEPEIEAEVEVEEAAEAVEAAEEPEEEKSEGPWKVVKNPSEAENRGEKDE
ncbi:TPA: exosome complex exonuclease Rrp41 [Methanosarcina acetivorans]|jgi:exosome complex component RRP41|uniref:Exosome complex component Rrp41 n=1 Tax=Methanosarcina acetivorans TaxID=2214 RepID=A0A832SKX0_9EURY|nr:exosome complex exonuclease Rrp41 [Methanosarcina acetivorans]HIH95053.1 exosome complex exonuclease Rrp41 [Methanosarcina acetivorans]